MTFNAGWSSRLSAATDETTDNTDDTDTLGFIRGIGVIRGQILVARKEIEGDSTPCEMTLATVPGRNVE